jgi:hypothetical protein
MYLLGGMDMSNNIARRTLFLQSYKEPVTRPPMSEKRSHFPSVFGNFEQVIYAVGGWNGETVISGCERFEIMNNKWKTMGNLNIPRRDASIQNFGQLLFVFGGMTKNNISGGLEIIDTIEKYVIEFDMWQTLVIRMSEPLRSMISFPLGGGRILIFGQKFDEMESIQVLDLTPDFTVLPNDEAKGMLPIHAYDPMRRELIYFISD